MYTANCLSESTKKVVKFSGLAQRYPVCFSFQILCLLGRLGLVLQGKERLPLCFHVVHVPCICGSILTKPHSRSESCPSSELRIQRCRGQKPAIKESGKTTGRTSAKHLPLSHNCLGIFLPSL